MVVKTDIKQNAAAFDALVEGRHSDPFAVLGLHRVGKKRVIRTLQPQAQSVDLVDGGGNLLVQMERTHPEGLFSAILPSRKRRYRLRIRSHNDEITIIEDCYRFATTLGELDLYLLGEGSDNKIYDKLGAHLKSIGGISGTRFAVWAPNAVRVSVIGDFNDWDGRRHIMRLHRANGIWEIFVPGIATGVRYKFEMLDQNGQLLPLKSDPFASFHEPPPGNASIVYNSNYNWQDENWTANKNTVPRLDQPVSIYEVHLGSWRRHATDGHRCLSYRELADELVNYVTAMGFTHIEFMPVSEHPFDGSWGYQPIGMFAPTQRFGEPDDFRYLVDRCHQAEIAVIVDWVPAHFPRDEHGLCRFDGTALYEHEDPRQGEHADWGTLIFNFGRREVVNYLIGSALYWIDEFHIDGIRVDAVASMLYLDYSRDDGEWLPNEYGGNENLDAVAFLKRLNTELHAHGAVSFAEESTAWPGVSHPVENSGLGFTYKWNMGWMNDTLAYISEEPVHRKHHHDKMTFGLVYAFDENFILPLSHDEVVHGKRSLLGRMPGDQWQRFANLRAYYASMYTHPGKKLLFMGNEIAQDREWSHDRSLDWHLLEHATHKGIQNLVRDLNLLYCSRPAFYELDFSAAGFEWIEYSDRDNSVISWIRRDKSGGFLICITNFTPVVRELYRVGVPQAGRYRELLNTDAEHYGGTGLSNSTMSTESVASHSQSHTLSLVLPALATLVLEPVQTTAGN